MHVSSRGAIAALIGLGALFACTTSSDPTSSTNTTHPPPEGVLPCDVDTVLETSCRGCHASSPKFGAPMPLATLADLHATSRTDANQKVYERAGARVHDDAKPMPPPPNARLGENALSTLDAWIAAGAPAGKACETPPKPGKPDTNPLSCNADVHMAPASPWTMPDTTDDIYVCYGFDVTNAEKRHLVGIAPKIDNPSIVHHLVLFQSDSAIDSKPTACPMTTSARWRIVYGWAPGGGNFEFPPEAGYPQEKTTHYVVQIHYNNVQHVKGQKDESGFDFCTTDKLRPNDADSVVFGPTSFSIPARSKVDLTCDAKLPATFPDVHLFAAFPHMHQKGTLIATTQLDGTGKTVADLGKQEAWDFQNQVYMPIDSVLHANDTVRTRCAWKNDSAESISFGERTQDEMCFSFTMYWPKIKDPRWSWMTPSLMTKCRPSE
jgi:hypothetical protein